MFGIALRKQSGLPIVTGCSFERMRKRLAADRASFIEPCLPSPADQPPSGANWIHEIKHDGYRLMARRDPVGIRLLNPQWGDWSRAVQGGWWCQ